MVGTYTMGHAIAPAFPEQNIRMIPHHAEAVASMVVQVAVMIASNFAPTLASEVLDRMQEIKPVRKRLAED